MNKSVFFIENILSLFAFLYSLCCLFVCLFYFSFTKRFIFTDVCICSSVYAHGPMSAFGGQIARITGGYEPDYVGAGNRTFVIFESNK